MKDNTSENSPFAKIDHVGIIVKDIGKAVQYYQTLGLGPFETPQNVKVIDKRLHGRPADGIKIERRMAQVGSMQIELIQPVKGESIPKGFLETKGEGINHLAFCVDDIHKETTRVERMGFKLVYELRFQNGGGTAYFDTDRVGGVIFELIQWPQGT